MTSVRPRHDEHSLLPPTLRQPAGELGPRGQRTISRILDAARQVFLANGYTGTTIDEIARLADVSRASVYTYFPSKRDVLLAAGARSATDAEECIDRLAELGADRAGMVRWAAEYFEVLDAHGSFAFAWTQAAHDDEELRTAGMKRHLRTCARLGTALAGSRHAVVEDPAALGLAVCSLFERMWSYGALYGSELGTERLQAVTGELVWSIARGLEPRAG